jgi:hypothetical protein
MGLQQPLRKIYLCLKLPNSKQDKRSINLRQIVKHKKLCSILRPLDSSKWEIDRLAPPFMYQLNLSIYWKVNLRPLSALRPKETTCYNVMWSEVLLKTLLILKHQLPPLTACTRTSQFLASRRHRMTSVAELKKKFSPTQSSNQASLTTSTTLKVSQRMPRCHQGLVHMSQLKWNF